MPGFPQPDVSTVPTVTAPPATDYSSSFTSNQSIDDKISELQKPEDKQKLIDFVLACCQESDNYRNQYATMTGSYIKDYEKRERLYNGILYEKMRQKSYESKPDDYRYYADLEVDLMLQYTYTPKVKQIDDDDVGKNAIDATSLERTIAYANHLNNSEDKREDLLQIRAKHGNAYVYFQPFEKDGVCWPGHEVVEPKYIVISPGAIGPEDATYIGYKCPVPTVQIKQKFPEVADKIDPDVEISDIGSGNNTSLGSGETVFTAIGSAGAKASFDGSQSTKGGTNSKQNWLTRFFYMDPELIVVSDEASLDEWMTFNPGFGTGKFRQRIKNDFLKKMGGGPISVLRYPFGRRIMTTNKVLLEDVPNPYPWFPFVNYKCFKRSKTSWAKGVIDVVRDPIKRRHLMLASLGANVDYRCRPTFQGSGNPSLGKMQKLPTEPNSFTYTGLSGSKIEPIAVPTIAPPDVIQLAALDQQNAERTSGLNSITAGNNPTGNYSGTHFEKQLEQAMRQVAQRFKRVIRAEHQLGDMYMWFIQNYCTDDRKFMFLSPDEGEMLVRINKLSADPLTGQPLVMNDVTEANYQFQLESGIDRPVTGAEKRAMMKEIAKFLAPVAPKIALELNLKSYDFPGLNGILMKASREIDETKSKAEQAQKIQQAFQAQQAADQARAKDMELEIKATTAEAKLVESQSWMVTNLIGALQKAGLQIPMSVVQDAVVSMGLGTEAAQNIMAGITATNPNGPQPVEQGQENGPVRS